MLIPSYGAGVGAAASAGSQGSNPGGGGNAADSAAEWPAAIAGGGQRPGSPSEARAASGSGGATLSLRSWRSANPGKSTGSFRPSCQSALATNLSS
eukprot:16439337-Heterocapsa_arctica.AAC.1